VSSMSLLSSVSSNDDADADADTDDSR
jgi:hypothetical protein